MPVVARRLPALWRKAPTSATHHTARRPLHCTLHPIALALVPGGRAGGTGAREQAPRRGIANTERRPSGSLRRPTGQPVSLAPPTPERAPATPAGPPHVAPHCDAQRVVRQGWWAGGASATSRTARRKAPDHHLSTANRGSPIRERHQRRHDARWWAPWQRSATASSTTLVTWELGRQVNVPPSFFSVRKKPAFAAAPDMMSLFGM